MDSKYLVAIAAFSSVIAACSGEDAEPINHRYFAKSILVCVSGMNQGKPLDAGPAQVAVRFSATVSTNHFQDGCNHEFYSDGSYIPGTGEQGCGTEARSSIYLSELVQYDRTFETDLDALGGGCIDVEVPKDLAQPDYYFDVGSIQNLRVDVFSDQGNARACVEDPQVTSAGPIHFGLYGSKYQGFESKEISAAAVTYNAFFDVSAPESSCTQSKGAGGEEKK